MINNILKTITDFIKAIAPFVVAFLARMSGKQKERLDNAEKVIESVERAKKIDSDVNKLDYDGTINELHNDWSR